MKKSVTYFEKGGSGNTKETVRLAKERATELGIRDVVVASSHGGTAIEVAKAFRGLSVNIVAVTICEGYRDQGWTCLLYTSPSPRDRTRSRMPSSA